LVGDLGARLRLPIWVGNNCHRTAAVARVTYLRIEMSGRGQPFASVARVDNVEWSLYGARGVRNSVWAPRTVLWSGFATVESFSSDCGGGRRCLVVLLLYLLFRRVLAVAALRLRSREFKEPPPSGVAPVIATNAGRTSPHRPLAIEHGVVA
jgi:hypothetical protein